MLGRKMLVGAAVLMLAGCGGAEEYDVPAGEAASMLAGLSYSPALSPMPAAIESVQVYFESLPGGQSVQWSFSRGRDDLGRIVATVEPSGDTASKVKVDYVEGSDHGGGTAGRLRKQIKDNVKQLVVEAVDSTLDRRPFDQALRAQVDARLTEAMGPTKFSGVDASLEAEVARRDRRDSERKSRPTPVRDAPSPHDATRPATDLSRFN